MTTQPTISIESIADWSDACRIETRNGPRNLRTAEATEQFWAHWKASKAELKAAGVSCGRNRQTGEWEACWWQQISEAEVAEQAAAQEASRAASADIEIPVPEGLEYLPYQKAGIAYAMDRPNVLIGDEMGLGKTIQAIGIANADPSIKRILVLCPASLRLNWARELKKWLVRPAAIGVVENGKPEAWRSLHGAEVVVCNYDVVKKHRAAIDKVEWDLLICDECQYLKNGKAARTKAVYGAKSRDRSKAVEPIKSRRTVCLSGTPMVNRPIELWSLVERLDPDNLGRSFFGFAQKYADAKRTRFGWDFSGASNLDQLQRLLRERIMVRRLKADVLTELPAKRRQVVTMPANGAAGAVKREQQAAKSHQDAIDEAIAAVELAKAGDDYEAAVERLTVLRRAMFADMSKIRQEVAVSKVPYVISHVEDALEGGPVVLFAHHRKVIELLVDHFGEDRVAVITGQTSMQDRQDAVDRFQKGEVDLFVGNLIAAGTGLTLVRSSHVIFAELDWVPGNVSQAEDRCHRIGQNDSVLVQHLVLDGSIDALMAQTIVNKQQVIDAALDKDCQELQAEVAPATIRPATETVTRSQIVKAAAQITNEQIAAVHTALRTLSGMCDGASAKDGCGFNKIDSRIGKSLAEQGTLTPKQGALGQKLVRKYKRQLGDDLLASAGVN